MDCSIRFDGAVFGESSISSGFVKRSRIACKLEARSGCPTLRATSPKFQGEILGNSFHSH